MKGFNLKYQIATGVVLVIGGTLILLSDFIKDKRETVFSEMNLTLTMAIQNNEIPEEVPTTEEVPFVEETPEVNNTDYNYEDYFGIVEINKIGLYKGFYNKESNLNNVKFNLYVLPESNNPDAEKGNLIIAGHSGNYNNSYFGNLYQLVIEDTINIYYNDSKYIYKIVKIYNEEKDGTVRILRDKNKTTLTLITCTKDDDYHQTIYIAELIDKQ